LVTDKRIATSLFQQKREQVSTSHSSKTSKKNLVQVAMSPGQSQLDTKMLSMESS
jgi:hypothetical protein